ncbi:MAG: preprotein translocase subunit SecD [Mycobacterium sp.]|jgi:preprotein translocase subunit SecD|nr:preprotein translocase subunit SecD [Mycobacterium sp.]
MYTPTPPPPPVLPPQPSRSRATPWLVALMILVLVVAYLLVGFLTRDKWLGGKSEALTEVTLTANTPDGAPPSSQALTRSQEVISERLRDLGIEGHVNVDGDQLVVGVPGRSADPIRGVALSGRLYIRPVIDSLPVNNAPDSLTPTGVPSAPPGPAPTSPGAPPPDPANDRAKAIQFQKLLRQTPGLERQAAVYLLQTRCNGADLLAGNDDPHLPLVTCGEGGTKDQKMIYLLDKSIISGDQIDTASSGFDKQGDRWVVDLTFNSTAANAWADYTASHIGTATGFVIDTQVVSAPVIREAIPGGNTQITGDFTADAARDLASALKSGALPISFSAGPAEPKSVPVNPSTPLRIGLVVAGVVVLAVTIGLVIYLARRRRTVGPTPEQDTWQWQPPTYGPGGGISNPRSDS